MRVEKCIYNDRIHLNHVLCIHLQVYPDGIHTHSDVQQVPCAFTLYYVGNMKLFSLWPFAPQ